MKVTRFYAPRNLDLEPLRKLGRAEYFEKLLFFISTIHFCRVTNRRYKENDYIPLKTDTLGRFIRKNDVARVRADLIRLGIIECDGVMIYGKKCYGHRLTAKYRGEKMMTIKANYLGGKDVKHELQFTSPQEYIYRNLQRVTIQPEALELIEENLEASTYAYNCALTACHFIADENWFFSTDKQTGRVYHNVANLDRNLRPFLRLDGKPLVEVDISNCQPMLLHTVYKDKNCAEAKRYKALVESGKFYEVFQAMTGYSREEAKGHFLCFAFGRVEHAASGKFGRAFTDTFPELRATMDAMKKKDFRRLCQHLTKLEADLVINTVVPICQSRGIPVLTVHDSLMVLPEHAESVRQLIIAECGRLYNLAPVTKAKGFVPVEYLEAA